MSDICLTGYGKNMGGCQNPGEKKVGTSSILFLWRENKGTRFQPSLLLQCSGRTPKYIWYKISKYCTSDAPLPKIKICIHAFNKHSDVLFLPWIPVGFNKRNPTEIVTFSLGQRKRRVRRNAGCVCSGQPQYVGINGFGWFGNRNLRNRLFLGRKFKACNWKSWRRWMVLDSMFLSSWVWFLGS